MMRLIVLPALGAAMMLAACSQEAEAPAEPAMEEAAPDSQFGFAQAMEGSAPAEPVTTNSSAPSEGEAARDRIEVAEGSSPPGTDAGSPPQIAYVFDYGFRLAGEAIAPLQQRHADLCEKKGPNICRIISMEQGGSEGQYVHGTLQLAVASTQARSFGKQLTQVAESADGEQISSAISGEDLSKQIVDTEARLRARTLLRDRLMEVLATRRGTVAELVEAERGVAQVNEEIDQATSWLAEMRGRVAYSRMNIAYESGSPSAGGFMDPIRGAFGNIGTILGWFIGALITLLTIGLPLLLIVLAIRFGWKRSGLAMPGVRGKDDVGSEAPQ
jgi:hypothetical protein